MSDAIYRAIRPTGSWQIMRCQLLSAPPSPGLAGVAYGEDCNKAFA